jgi:hypothetical protein
MRWTIIFETNTSKGIVSVVSYKTKRRNPWAAPSFFGVTTAMYL